MEELKEKGIYRKDRKDNDGRCRKGTAQGNLEVLRAKITWWYRTYKKFKGLTNKYRDIRREENKVIVELGGERLKYLNFIRDKGLEEDLKNRLEE